MRKMTNGCNQHDHEGDTVVHHHQLLSAVTVKVDSLLTIQVNNFSPGHVIVQNCTYCS